MKRTYIFILSTVLALSIFTAATLKCNTLTASKVISSSYSDYPTIVIDAGHGGEDGGASDKNGNNEKDINLDIALTLQKILMQSGYNVKMIRTTDISVHDANSQSLRDKKVSDIHNRTKTANSSKNNILVSIHQNHFSESKYSGAQIFYSKNNLNSEILAEKIRAAITGLIQPQNSRKCKKASDIYLMDNVNIPAVIVECGFLSNSEEAALLSKKEYKDDLAYCIYLGIIEYIYLNK